MKLPVMLSILLFSMFTALGQTKYEKDFNEFWNDINNNYAYFDQQQIDWKKVKDIYGPQVTQVSDDNAFIRLLETVINELHNGHISLNTALFSSNRIVPSGQDVFVSKQNGKYYITDIRKGFAADLSGLKIGNEVVLFNGKPIAEQLGRFMPKYTDIHNEDMYQYAMNMLFAGTYDVKREFTINKNGTHVKFYPDNLQNEKTTELVYSKVLNKTTAYIKINNSLGDAKTIEDFDQAVDLFMPYKNLIIDLTETPGGGNTTVARCMMGRFIKHAMPYQMHEFDEKGFETKRQWVEYVTPRKTQFKGKVFLLVGHWTGSMGEGIAVGFDALKRATIIGTEMAGLLGAVNSFKLSETNIGFQFPTERLSHIYGTPREKYKPGELTANIEETLKRMKEID